MLDRAELDRLRPVRSSLTQREWEVLDLLVEGAATRGRSPRSSTSASRPCGAHVKHVLDKLGMHSRDEAVRYVKRLRHSRAYTRA